MNALARRIVRHSTLAAALLFLLLGLIFFAHVLIPPEGQVLAGHDMTGNYYIYWEVVREVLRSGHLPLWEPAIFGGFPLLAQPQSNTFYPPNWINLIVPVRVGVSLTTLFHVWLAAFGMFLFTRYMGSRWTPAVLAGIGFAFGGLLAGRLYAGHQPVYAVFIWTPLMLLGLAWAVDRRSWATAVLAGMPIALSILAGHVPSFLYVGLIWAAFAVYLLITRTGERLLVARAALIALVVGLALAAVQLAPFLQFSVASGRVAEADYEFATDYSLPPAHLITLIVPEFFGEPTRVGYWSVPTFEELTYYAGILAVLGLILALRRPDRLTWFYVVLIVIGLWLALGRYGILFELAYRFLPPFRLVRAPGRAAFLYLFAASALLAHALTFWRDMPADERRRALRIYWPAVIAVAGIALFAALAATGAVFMSIHPTDTSGRLWHQIGGYSLALVVVGVGGALLWAYLTNNGGRTADDRRPTMDDGRQRPAIIRRRSFLIAFALILLVVADTWWFAYKMARTASTTPDPVWTDGRALVGEPTSRVLPWGVPLFSQNGAMQVDWWSVFGYDSLEPAAHIALASSVPDPRSTAYDVLGVSHVLAGGPLDEFTEGDRPLSLVGQQGSAWVYERARTLPIVRMVYDAEVIPEAAAAIARIHDPAFDPATTAILDEEAPCDLDPTSTGGQAEVIVHEPTRWVIRTRSETPALLVVAEDAYPGWAATVDGAPAAALTAYTSVRAVCIPAGEHTVEWAFTPRIVYWGAAISGLALLLLAAALITARRSALPTLNPQPSSASY
jgi:hypothetical protein